MIQVFPLHIRNPCQNLNIFPSPIIAFIKKAHILSLLKNTECLLLRIVVNMANVTHRYDCRNKSHSTIIARIDFLFWDIVPA